MMTPKHTVAQIIAAMNRHQRRYMLRFIRTGKIDESTRGIWHKLGLIGQDLRGNWFANSETMKAMGFTYTDTTPAPDARFTAIDYAQPGGDHSVKSVVRMVDGRAYVESLEVLP